MSSNASQPVKFEGVIQEVRYRDGVDGFSILTVHTQLGSVSVKGHTTAGLRERISVEGRWVRHAKHGPQVEAIAIVPLLPEGLANMERFLGSGLIKGLGPKQAARIIAAFGEQAFEVLDNSPERLAEIPGLGAKTIAKVQESWAEKRAAARILAALAGHDIGPGTAVRIYKHFGAEALKIIRSDPYRLSREIRGIGFKVADAIGRTSGIAFDAAARIEAGIAHVLSEATGRGSTGMARSRLIARSRELLEVSEHVVCANVDRMCAAKSLLIPALQAPHGPVIFERQLHDAEQRIAQRIRDLLSVPLASRTPAARASLARKAEGVCGVTLAPEQRAAVEMALAQRVSVLTGGPGTGKTSTLKAILEAVRQDGRSVVLGAPTGKAAKRMQQSTQAPAATLARLVGQGGADDADRTIEADVLIVDEASMIDVSLLDRTLACLRPNASIVFVGDVDQLPSVGPGRVLADLIECGTVPVTRLTQIFRQAAESSIIRNAHRINNGEALDLGPCGRKDFIFVASTDAVDTVDRIAAIVRERIPAMLGLSVQDIQVLSPMRKGEAGVSNLNAVLQHTLNPSPPDAIVRGASRFAVGDRVIQTVNNYQSGIMNGESGVIRAIDREAGTLKLDVDGKQVDYVLDDLDQLDLAYAISIHKSQGSQFPAVVVPICSQHTALLQRSILYTAVTRASQFCVVVGDPKAVSMAIANVRTDPRITALRDALMNDDARLDQVLSAARSPGPFRSLAM
ncbi:hypothetical protein [Dolichospermum phage Dfl-JY45]